MRAAGVECGPGHLVTAHRALAAVEPDRRRARVALRASLCASRDDIEVFERAFEELFGDRPIAPIDPGKGEPQAAGGTPSGALGTDEEEEEGEEPDGEEAHRVGEWSAIEVLREKSFRAYTPQDRELARDELRRLAAELPWRPSPRSRRAPARAPRLDLRRTMHAAVRHGGDPAELRWRRRGRRPRRLVFVCDVSGSMAPFAEIGLEYVHAVLRAGAPAEAFCFGTRLTRITLELRAGDVAGAFAAAEAKAVDRAGGTRIGAAIAALNREYRHRLGRGAVVVILSDGWDRGEPGLLAVEMAHLRRTSHAVLWLDPHLAEPAYEPLTRGMRESLPSVRAAFPGDRLSGLIELTEATRGLA
ncbi:MAG: hypothetical protein BGO11_09745 [Solirubrobacterales bacterium 70-9]|nr:MAG: hypothetical protein BGO11_09745 [Solirubrobacterales bacterium 70-9]